MLKPTVKRTVVLLGLLIFLIPGTALSAQENRIALVIGNGAYKSSPLANPVNDANDMATELEKCDFKVTKSINADRKEMRRVIREFGDEINKGAVGLFYYAGHGIQVNGENYLVPIGAEVYREDEVKDECLMVSSVLRKMETAGNRLNIIILDACRDNPFGRSFRSSKMGLAKMDAPTGSILAYATAPGSVAADGTGGNGLYTSMLLKHMTEPNLTIERMFKRVRIDVVNVSGKRQTPWESSSLMGDFYFNTKRGITVEKRPVAETEKPTKKIPEYTSISPEYIEPEIVARDGNFIKYDNEIIFDANTNLEWYVGPDRDTNWNEAKKWVDNLTVAGGGWRMPTINEIATLYKKGAGTRNITPLLKHTGYTVVSGEIENGDSIRTFFLGSGGLVTLTSRETGGGFRVFAVRSQHVRAKTEKKKQFTKDTPKYASIDKNLTQRGWIGISVQDLSEFIAKFYGMKESEGVLVTETYPGAPAYKAGIKRGDIILSVNGKKIKNTKVLVSITASLKVGEMTIIEVYREGEEKTFKVKAANRSEMPE